MNILPINQRMKELAEKAEVKGAKGEWLRESDEQEIRRLEEIQLHPLLLSAFGFYDCPVGVSALIRYKGSRAVPMLKTMP
jgi:hypothetical protein